MRVDSVPDTQLDLKLTAQMNQGFVHSLAKRYNTTLLMLQLTIRVVPEYLNNKW